MGSALEKREAGALEARHQEGVVMPIRRIGSSIGLATIGLLDLLALDDITTAGAWMPEIGFVLASIPALIVLGYYAFRRSGRAGPEGEPVREEGPHQAP